MKFLTKSNTRCPVNESVPLKPKTYVKIGGRAPVLFEPRIREEMSEAVRLLLAEKVPFRLLGGGSNLLIDGAGPSEAVISTRGLSRLYKDEEDSCTLYAEAGVSLARIVSTCQKYALTGAECLIGIPGTVGGAAVMNAGGRHGAMGDLLRGALLLDPAGEYVNRSCAPAEFGYRISPLKGETVVEVTLKLKKGNQDEIWDRMTEILKEKKAHQPLMEKSCGCVFKNPPGDSAGRLLDSAGLKGKRHGFAEISTTHANFFLNKGDCTFRDYHALILEATQKVKEMHNIDLALEVEIWSHSDANLP